MKRGPIVLLIVFILTVAIRAQLSCDDPHEHRSGCGECQPTCSNRHPGPCPKINCFIAACTCKSNYIREFDKTSRCILETECPQC